MTLGEIYKNGAKQICPNLRRTGLSGVHWIVSGAQVGTPNELAALEKTQCSSAKNHRIVRWATSNGHLHQRSTATRLLWVQNARSLETVCDVRSHQTVRCATRLSGAPQGQTKSTVDCSKPLRSANVACIGQWTVLCPVRHRLSGVPVNRELSQRLE
jgi:hypothetical protein